MEHDCAWDYIYIYIERERKAALGYNVFHLFIF